MPKTFLKKSTGWTEMKSIFVKKSTGWTETKSIFIKKLVTSQFGQLATWVKVYTKASLPDTTTPPSIRTTNTGSGTIYDGPAAESPQYLNANLYGKDGLYINYTSIFGRKMTSATTAAALPAARTTVVTGDLFTSGGGVTTADRTAIDGKYLFYELTVQNGSSANEIPSVSSPIKMIKKAPTTTDFQWTGVEQAGTELVLNYVYENYYYNSIDPALSYIKWWRNTSPVPGGTLIKTETITATTTGTPSSTSRSGTSYYTPDPITDIGFYIVAETTASNSFTINGGYTNNYTVASFPTEIIGPALDFSNVRVEDYYGNNGLDNRNRWPVGTINRYAWTINGYDASTTVRIRYRMYNFDTGRYYKPSTGAIQADTTAGANAAYDSYNSNGTGAGYISSIIQSGTTAACYDYFNLDSTYFNGGGSGPTWWLEIELSMSRGIGRIYELGVADFPAVYYTGKGIIPSISASSSEAQVNTNITFSGSFLGTPATPSQNSYPRQYKIYYGDNTDSGWLPVGEYAASTLNPTYSVTKQYSTSGTYSASIRTIPYGTSASTSVTINGALSAPTPSGVIWNGTSFVISYTGGSGPWFQSWYRADNTTYPSDGTGFDSGSATQNATTITYTPGFTPTPGSTYSFWVRSATSATANSSGVNVSSYSTTRVQVLIPAVATAPTLVTAANNYSSTTLTVSWSGATNAAYYRIYWTSSSTAPSDPGVSYDEEKVVNGSTITSSAGSWAWGPGDQDKNNNNPAFAGNYYFYVSASANGTTWTPYVRTSGITNLALIAPNINFVTPGVQGGPVSVDFGGGSGPYYQMFWWGTASAPTASVTPDQAGVGPVLTDNTGPSSTATQYMYVRSVVTTGDTSAGASSTASAWSTGIPFNMTSNAVVQSTAPTAKATGTNSTTVVKYLDSITWSGGTYTNASSVTSTLRYSTQTSLLVSPSGDVDSNTSFRATSPYSIQTSDPAGTPYYFAVRDKVVGVNGTTYYFYSNQILSAKADGVAFSYGTATSATGGWTASISGTSQSGASYSYVSATVGSATVNSTSGAISATGLTSAASSTVTVSKTVSGYSDITSTGNGTASTVTTYTLQYSANSGSITPTSQTGIAGASITLASGAGTRTGYTFGGWTIGTTTYAASGAYTFGSADATATAIWTLDAVVPTPPTSPSVSPGTLTATLSTGLSRNTSTNKTQSWSTSTARTVTISWTKGTGAGTIYTDIKWNQTGTTPSGSDSGTWNNNSGTTQTDLNGGASTNYYWIRTSDGTGTKSAWVSAGSYTVAAPVMSGLVIRIYRGNGTAFSTGVAASTSTSGTYTYAGLTNRDASPDYGHYAYASGSVNGTGKTATSGTV